MNVTETHAANITFPAFERLGFLDKSAYAIPYYAYSSGIWNYIDPDVFPFALSIGTATFCVIAGSHATVSKPANALDPNVEVESQLWDPSDRDDSRYIHTNAADLEFLNGTSIDFKQAVAMPVKCAGALYGLYYCLQNIDVTKLVYYLNWYLLLVSLTSNYSVFDFAITYLVRTISFWLRLPGNSLAVFARYKATLSTDEKSDTFPLGQLEQVSASSFNHGPEWFDGLQRHLSRENVEILHPTSIPVKNQKFNFVFDLKFLLSVPLSIFGSALYYLHNPTLNSSYPFDTTNWLLANAMGINFAIFGIRVTRLSNFKVATGLLFALFLYDIYFVFGTKVMVTVATGIDIPIKIVYPRQPNYLISNIALGSEGFKYWDVPTSLLGLGDIVIPGAFISACLRFDLYRHHQRHTSAFHHLRRFSKPYFYCAVVCYICSLIVTVVVLKVYAVGQPALLYIVPSLFLGVYGTALAKGELKELWQYSEHIEEYKGTESSDKNPEESDAEYVDESDDSYDEWEDRVESERAAGLDEVETDSDDIQVLESDLQRPVSRSLVTYEFADSDDEDDDTFIIDGEEDEEESFASYAMVSSEEIAILAKDRLTEARAWYSDEDDN